MALQRNSRRSFLAFTSITTSLLNSGLICSAFVPTDYTALSPLSASAARGGRCYSNNFPTTALLSLSHSASRRTTSTSFAPTPCQPRSRSVKVSSLQMSSRAIASIDKGPLESLCTATLQACRALMPTISALYKSINDSSSKSAGTKAKSDSSAFTIADGLVQYLLIEELLSGVVGDIVGEENCEVNMSSEPYSVDDLIIPVEFTSIIEEARTGVAKARQNLLESASDCNNYCELTAFIDPIDGTREFSSGNGEQCSICVGYSADACGLPVAGVVYRPLYDPPTWAAGAKDEGYFESSLDRVSAENKAPGLLTSNGSISPFIEKLMEELNCQRVPSGGAGNKMLMLLEGKGSAYIQDRGVSRWDTCAAQAVLEANDGLLCKLSTFIGNGDEGQKEEPYTYRKTEENLDFMPELASLTKYNAATGANVTTTRMATDVSEVKAYSNLCGLLALGNTDNTEEAKTRIYKALKRARESSPPAFD